jgi:prolyl oligopeptidase
MTPRDHDFEGVQEDTMHHEISLIRRLITSAAGALCLTVLAPGLTPLSAQVAEDPYLWLENVESQRSMEWVLARNQETTTELKDHPAYQSLYDETLAILTSDERIAYPSIHGDHLYNFWTDGENPRGIWRRADWDSYLSGTPDWEVVLDIDALVESEGVPWAFAGASCLEPEYRHCLVNLSRGGADATEVREFDTRTREFVEGGFRIPESKNTVTWVDQNTILLAPALDPRYMTTSGYARAVWRWERGTSLESATIVAEAEETDMGMWLGSLDTPRGAEPMVIRLKTIFTSDQSLYREGSLVPLEIPDDANPVVASGQLVIQLVSDWEVNGQVFSEGSLVSADLEGFLAGDRSVELVLEPGPRSTINGVTSTRDYLLVNQLTNVRGQLIRYRREDGEWVPELIPTPDMGAVGINSTSSDDNRFFFTFTSFIQPNTLYLARADGSITEVRRMPNQFVTSNLVVEQFEATSVDGTQVPYFVVRNRYMPMDGTVPTLLTAYGGFQISRTPGYLGVIGKGWVERGGVYVLANIRGGGEFGPSWWKSALKENRQRAYDDFLSVAEDLVARGIASPETLGIQGGSNGGLLVGVAMTQRPDLFNAVVVQVPLLDMKRYHLLLAGASWMAEYGNPDIPEEWDFIGRYSPYQNVHAEVEYPTPFFTTTTRDDRVHPGHARKMAARMMEQGHDIYYFENVEGGHGAGVTPEQRAEAIALSMAYLMKQLAPGWTPVP